jgi:hypothetical protein
MSINYWSQWDRQDLDSWQGKDIVSHDDDYFDCHEDREEPEEEYGCHCGNCMDCLGMSWRDFM